MTRSHEMRLNLNFGNLRYLHVSNLQVLLVILILKSRLDSKKCGFDVFLQDAGVAEAILRKSALKFSEHISANTPKFNACRLSFCKNLKTPR